MLATFQARRERLLGAQGELSRMLTLALPTLDGPLGEERSLALLEMMRTPQVEAQPNGRPRLTYVFLADELLAQSHPDEIAEQALDHLLGGAAGA